MAEEIIGLKVELDTSGASAPMASLKSQIKEATNELVNFTGKFGATSKEAINAAKRVAELKDRLGDARQMVDAFNPDAKFNALTQSISGAASAFSAVQGAMGLFGVESANTEKALLRVQSAMAFSQGLSNFLDGGIEGFKNLYKQISGPIIEGFTALKTAIGSIGIGLLITGLVVLIANWDKLKTAVGGVTDEQSKLIDTQKKLNEAYKDSSVKNAANDVLQLKINIGLAKDGVLNKDRVVKQYNETIGKTTGIVKNLDEAEQQLTKNGDKYVKMMLFKAAANLALEEAAKFALEAENNRLKSLDEFENKFLDAPTQITTEEGYKNYQKRITDQRNLRRQEEVNSAQNAANKQLSIANDFMKKATDISSTMNFNLFGDNEEKKVTKAASAKKGKTDIEILKEKYASELLAAQEFHLTNIEKEEDYEKKKLAITEKYLKTKLGTNDQTHVELLNAQKDINAKLRELDKQVEEEPPAQDPKVLKAKEVVQLLLDTEGNYIAEKDDLYYQDRQKSILSATKQLEVIRDLRIKTFDNEVLKIRQEHNVKFEIIKGNKAAEIALEEETAAKIAALRQSVINQNIDAYMEAASSINGILSQSNANQLADLEANSQARIAAAGGNKEAILAIENETAIEKNRLQNEQVKRDKLFAIAEAIINTYKAAAQVFARPAFGDPVTSLGIKIASMVAAVASGIANVMAIRKVPLPSGGGAGGGDVSGGSAPNSPMGTVFNTITKLNKDSIDKINDKAVKAYVVETDINNGQKRIERILINTKFK